MQVGLPAGSAADRARAAAVVATANAAVLSALKSKSGDIACNRLVSMTARMASVASSKPHASQQTPPVAPPAPSWCVTHSTAVDLSSATNPAVGMQWTDASGTTYTGTTIPPLATDTTGGAFPHSIVVSEP